MADSDRPNKGRSSGAGKARLRRELESLEKEMEIARFATNRRGNIVRNVPRSQSLERTRKRKRLEQLDAEEQAIPVVDDTIDDKRIRGSKAALEIAEQDPTDMLLLGGGEDDDLDGEVEELVDSEEEEVDADADDEDYEDSEESDEEVDEEEDVNEADDEEEGQDENNRKSPSQIEESPRVDGNNKSKASNSKEKERVDGVAKEKKDQVSNGELQKPGIPQKKTVKRRRKSGVRRQKKHHVYLGSGVLMARSMYRLKNFSSQKLAQRHGLALGAHARGQQKLAVQTLAEVAEAAPIAPQVYSSLGLLYENLLDEEQKRGTRSATASPKSEPKSFEIKLELGKKSYASYHVAAVLCKRDFTLWVRAGDAAMGMAYLYEDVMSDKVLGEGLRKMYRDYKMQWLMEAKDDYDAADRLRPPGVEVPSKLASVHMQLGNLSEALTILTDLRHNAFRLKNISKQRSELEKSFAAWMLFADLMLRIGYECKQWDINRTVTENYMFRRWLRKYHATFDWRERRLQALCLALEAAAGTKASISLVKWLKERAKQRWEERGRKGESEWNVNDSFETEREAERKQQEQPQESKNGEDNDKKDENNNPETNGKSVEESPPIITDLSKVKDGRFEQERTAMKLRHKNELEEFDADPNNLENKEGKRAMLVNRQKKELVEFIGRHVMSTNKPTDEPVDTGDEPLPMSGSCSTVCEIASQLMKHALGLKLYKCGRLAAESVSNYLKERYIRHKKRLEEIEVFNARSIKLKRDPLQLAREQKHDEPDILADEDVDESDVYLSDDEEVDRADSSSVAKESLKYGVLPPQIRYMCGLCMVGEGSRDFLAQQLLHSIDELPIEESSDFESLIDIEVIPDPEWVKFDRITRTPIKRFAGLVYLADLLTSSKKDEEWASRVVPLFEKHVKFAQGHRYIISIEGQAVPPVVNQTYRLKLLLFTARLKLIKAKRKWNMLSKDLDGEDGPLEVARSVLRDMEVARGDLWRGFRTPEGKPCRNSIEMISILCQTFKFSLDMLLVTEKSIIYNELVAGLLEEIKTVIEFVFKISIPQRQAKELAEEEEVEEKDSNVLTKYFLQLPFNSDWQRGYQMHLSKRTLLLCLANNVTVLSGYEDNEFTLEVLYGKRRSGFFGVKLQERLAGFLPQGSEKLLSLAWDLVNRVLPAFDETLDFEASIEETRELDWYKAKVGKFANLTSKGRIARLGEHDGLDLLLCFSILLLLKSEAASDDKEKEDLVTNAMSMILPVSQFGLDQEMWTSPIGKGIEDDLKMRPWLTYLRERTLFDGSADHKPITGTYVYKRPKDRPLQTSVTTAVVRKNKNAQVGGKKGKEKAKPKEVWKPTVARGAHIPVVMLLNEWNKDEHAIANPPQDPLLSARVVMKKVDYALRQLRSCVTIKALQKASLRVAAVMLEVAQDARCYNPLLCVSHAAMFAGQGSKGGNSDESFKERLPDSEAKCSPLNALLILGRADCLRAVSFTDEAIFLCSYVARVCALHRDPANTDYQWTSRWRVIGIQAWMSSVAIDASIASFLQQAPVQSVWNKEVLKELRRGRRDARAFEVAANEVNVPPPLENASGRTDEDSEDEGDAAEVGEENENEDEEKEFLDEGEESDEDGEVPLETDAEEEDQDEEEEDQDQVEDRDQDDHVVEEEEDHVDNETEVSPEKDVLQVYEVNDAQGGYEDMALQYEFPIYEAEV